MTDFLQAHPDCVILALDEMSLYFQATLTRVWAPVGQTPIVRVHPQRDTVHFYGALNLRDGREIASSWHFGAVSDLIDQTDRLQVLHFPPACPDLNPQEHVWERTRDAISHNHTYPQFQPLIEDFRVPFESKGGYIPRSLLRC